MIFEINFKIILEILVILLLINLVFVKEKFNNCDGPNLIEAPAINSYNSLGHSWCQKIKNSNTNKFVGNTIDDVNKCYDEIKLQETNSNTNLLGSERGCITS